MLFNRSTKSIVQGNRLEQALQPGSLKDTSETVENGDRRDNTRHKKMPLTALIACLALLILIAGIYLLYPSESPASETEDVTETLDGRLLISLETGLELTAGDVLRFYTAEGAIPSLRYVAVQSVSDSYAIILLTEEQLADFLEATADGEVLPALIIHQDSEAAEEALQLQAAWNDPEISIVLPEVLKLAVTDTTELGAVVTVGPEGAIQPDITYLSSDPSIVSVSAEGILTANAPGETEITVQCGDQYAVCAVTALLCVEKLEFESKEITIGVGGNAALTATASPRDYTETLEWTSSDESVATVDTEGNVTGISEGEAEITVSGQNASASYTVTVMTEAAHISLNRETMLLTAGSSGALAAAVTPEDASDKSVTWSSSNESVATVDTEGTVTAVSEGAAEITASCGSVSASCTVTVVGQTWTDTTDTDT